MDDDFLVDSDAELVLQARSGDRQAFAAIYDRYADRIHDFCYSVLRDRDEAADAMQDTFVLAAQRMGQLHDPPKLRSWLFAVARHEAIRRGKARRRMAPTDRVGDEVVSEAVTPEETVSRGDAQEIVWAAAAGLSDRDRVLLDLHLRQGLDGQDLADAIGVSAPHAYTLMNRLRDQVERSLGALLVARLGRDDCAELQSLLESWDGRFTPLWRKRVARHVDDCDVCSEQRRIFASPLSLLAAAPLVPAPVALRSLTLQRVDEVAAHGALTDQTGVESNADGAGSSGDASAPSGWPRSSARGGFPPGIEPHPWMRPALAVAAAAVLALIVFAASFFAFDDEDPASTVIAATSASSIPVADPGTVVAPGSSAPTTSKPASDEESEIITPGDTTPPDRDSTTTTSTTTPSDKTPPIVRASVTAADVWEESEDCQTTSTTASATVQDASSIKSVTLAYEVGAVSVSVPMTAGGGGTHTGTVGPFPVGTVTGVTTFSVQITAVDDAGNEASAPVTVRLHPASECVVIL